MINITRGNDFKLAVTFTRGGEDFKFDSVSSVSLLGTLDRKYSQAFSYADGKLTVKGSHSLQAGTYGLEVIGKEGDAVRRTAFGRVVAITNNTSAGTYDPEEEVDEYDIAIHVELDLSVDKTDTSSETKSDGTDSKSDSSETKSDGGTTASGSDTGTSTGGDSTASGSDSGTSGSGSDTDSGSSTGSDGDKSATEGQG